MYSGWLPSNLHSALPVCAKNSPSLPLSTLPLPGVQLPRGSDDVVSPLVLMRYIRESMILRHVYRCLAMYDSEGDGCLREHDLENYIFGAIPDAPELAALQDNFYPFYVFTAVRNLFFFLDPNRVGHIRLRDLVGSQSFSEWLKVLPAGHPFLGPAGESLAMPEFPAAALSPARPAAAAEEGAAKAGARGADPTPAPSSPTSAGEGSSKASRPACTDSASSGSGSGAGGSSAAAAAPAPASGAAATLGGRSTAGGSSAAVAALLAALQPRPPAPTNWFSASNALRVYSGYLELDSDQNGMLSPAELGNYQGRLYTTAFVQRLFQECHTYGSGARDSVTGEQVLEIDYKTYLDVVLASENRNSLPSQRFFFKFLDVGHRGAFGLNEINFFYGFVQERLAALGHDTVGAANVADEIFDMLKPAKEGVITFEDLRKSKMGGIACGMLLDASAFLLYDRREEMGNAHSTSEEETWEQQ